jgi:4-amino-4-deoxychorismate lyase
MVLYFKNQHTYEHDFETVTLAYFNRYPNPYSTHVKSIDTIDVYVDDSGRLHQVKLIKKSGRLPQFVKPFLGKISTSWIIENTIVDPVTMEMVTYNCNLDHRRIIRVEEYNTYKHDLKKNVTNSYVTVKFSSGFSYKFGPGLGIKDRIETWSKNKFSDNLMKSREGLKIVMDSVKQRLMAKNLGQQL